MTNTSYYLFKWDRRYVSCLIFFRCHASSGKCDCPPGWTGIYCDTPCPAGHYGQDCQEKCICKNGATCNHITGTSTDQGASINDSII